MNILFLTLIDMESIDERGIYQDLLSEFARHGHKLFIVSPYERRQKKTSGLMPDGRSAILKVKIGNIQKTNLIEKGITTITLERRYLSAIKKYFADVSFDLVLYSTPPITFGKVVNYVKKKDNAKSYLLLKDIFPQNAVDLEMMKKDGVLHKYFRCKEKNLYLTSDYIGCMSKANVDYVTHHNPYIDSRKVHILPNCIDPSDVRITEKEKKDIRRKYEIPSDSTIFIYGGNLGKPQGIPFIIQCLRANQNLKDRFFVICGTGTEYNRIMKYIKEEKPENILLIPGLPRNEYEKLVSACDVGLIFLDYRFTIPNFPSRLLSYMDKRMPVIASVDVNTDIGQVIEEGGFGFWCKSNSVIAFKEKVEQILSSTDFLQMKDNAKAYLYKNYTIKRAYEEILVRIYADKEY